MGILHLTANDLLPGDTVMPGPRPELAGCTVTDVQWSGRNVVVTLSDGRNNHAATLPCHLGLAVQR